MKLKTLQENNSFRNSAWYNPKYRDSFDGIFSCDNKGFDSLDGLPLTVNGSVFCNGNKLTDLKGAPVNVSGNFYCSHNELTSLEGCPAEIPLTFDCSVNHLTTLEFAPKCTTFICNDNRITSLKGAPASIQSFHCSINKLTSLDYAPSQISNRFSCDNNKISSLVGVDEIFEEIGDYFCFAGNPITEGGLGFLLISKLKSLKYGSNGNRAESAFDIIDYYLHAHHGEDAVNALYECQSKLLENGFEEFAEL